MEKWIVESKRADFYALAKRFGISPVLARVIRNRDVIGEEAVRQYLQGSLSDIPEASLLPDLEAGVQLLQKKIREHARVRILGDYDIDGVCSTYIMLRGLTRLGLDCDFDIPDRITDGYGMNRRMVQEALMAGADTIVTCDNGISAASEIAWAKEQGLSVIVTDHHEVPRAADGRELLPPADAVIDGKREESRYPFREICGAVTAWKLIGELYKREGIPEREWLSFLEFAAIATVGDVMPLRGENRILVREGLKRLHATENPGLLALMEANELTRESIRTYHLGFVLGPCLNAGGRLSHARLAMALFEAEDAKQAGEWARQLKALNDTRKSMTAEGVKRAEELIRERGWESERILLLHLPDCHESLAGIIAGRLREKYHRPAFVLTGEGEMLKGSGRSIPAYSMFEGLCRCQDLLERFGGHRLAAGLSVRRERLEELRERLRETNDLTEEDFIPEVRIDVALPIDYITEEFVEELKLLEPCGMGNRGALFAEQRFRILRAQVLGKNQNVVRLQVKNQAGCGMDAVYFGDAAAFRALIREEFGEDEEEKLFRGEKNEVELALAYVPEIHEYRGSRGLQLVVSHYCRIRR